MDTTPTDDTPTDLTGCFLGPYRLGARLGHGGSGDVYDARDTRTGIEVAIKVLHMDSDRTAIERFNREINFGCRLGRGHENPYIAHIIESGRTNGLRWFAMERLHGKTLRALIHDGAATGMRWEAAARILTEVCAAVWTLHERQIVHRDLKPENIFVTYTGNDEFHIKLLDFGIAREVGEESQVGPRLTTRHEIPGTGPYMAPERVELQLCPAATDQYSLGVVLYECLHRQLPFPPSENYTSLCAQFHGALDKLLWRCAIPGPIKLIALRAMARDHHARFADVREMSRALDRCLEDARDVVDGLSAVIELLKLPSRSIEPAIAEERTTHLVAQLVRGDAEPRGRFKAAGEIVAERRPEASLMGDIEDSRTLRRFAGADDPRLRATTPAIGLQLPTSYPSDLPEVATPRPDDPSRSTAGPEFSSREAGSTVEEPPASAMLARHGSWMVRTMKLCMSMTMVALGAMTELAADPLWLQLQEHLRPRGGDAASDESEAEAELAEQPKIALARPSGQQAPAAAEPPASGGTNEQTGDAASASPPLAETPGDDPTAAVAAGVVATVEPSAEELMQQQALADKKLLASMLAVARGKARSICKLAPFSPRPQAEVCVRFTIDTAAKTITNATVVETRPANMPLNDKKGGESCVVRVARAHLDLRQLSAPTSFTRCFPITR